MVYAGKLVDMASIATARKERLELLLDFSHSDG